jgi:hypothetical protein
VRGEVRQSLRGARAHGVRIDFFFRSGDVAERRKECLVRRDARRTRGHACRGGDGGGGGERAVGVAAARDVGEASRSAFDVESGVYASKRACWIATIGSRTGKHRAERSRGGRAHSV